MKNINILYYVIENVDIQETMTILNIQPYRKEMILFFGTYYHFLTIASYDHYIFLIISITLIYY